MNGIDYGPLCRGVPHAEASADTATNSAVSFAVSSHTTGEIQVPRSPQALSLQVNGLEAGVYTNSNAGCVESSERGSETSDGQRPELHSASTFTESLPSQPSFSLNDSNRSMDCDNPPLINGGISSSTVQERSTLEALYDLKTNKIGTPYGTGSTMKTEYQSDHSQTPSNDEDIHLGTGVRYKPGHKRTATGDIKSVSTLAAPVRSDSNGVARRRSRSTGSPISGSRIAQLSVHIRTRLSYAAAKIEKSRRSPSAMELALRGLESLSASNTAPNGNASTSGSTPTTNSQRSQRPTPVGTRSNNRLHHRSQSAFSSSGTISQIPKLAPPADIVASSGEPRRRRPNPNWAAKPFDPSPHTRHRRHHSHQENTFSRPYSGSPRVMGPGTPSIPPTTRTSASQNGVYGSRTQSENTAMEQDAIETLLFMSSPENSGYRSSPRPLQPPPTQHSLNASLYAHDEKDEPQTQHSQSSQSGEPLRNQDLKSHSLGLGLEAHAGDEIDRILDQMDSDSEEDTRYASHRLEQKNRNPRWNHVRP